MIPYMKGTSAIVDTIVAKLDPISLQDSVQF
jgi:hypothetical protein